MKSTRKAMPGTTQFNADIPKDLFQRIKIDVAKHGTTKNIWTTAALQYFMSLDGRSEVIDDVAKTYEKVGEVAKMISTSLKKDGRGSRAPKR